MSDKRDSWSGHLAFILAGAASAIGLGNLWRFPYLAAQYGGGCFIVAYLSLALTLGCTLLITEVAIGRLSRQSQITAFSMLSGRKWWWIGALATLVPFLICPYYSVIGGWVIKYFVYYAKATFANASPIADPSAYFDAFVSSGTEPVIYMMAFIVITILIIICGVKNGIEKANSVMMPALFITAVCLVVYIAFLPGALEGIKFYLFPDFSRCDNICKLFLGAMGQMFFSLSLAMGIMVTYGSYMKSDSSIPHAAVRIAVADTFVAVLSGFMVIGRIFLCHFKRSRSGNSPQGRPWASVQIAAGGFCNSRVGRQCPCACIFPFSLFRCRDKRHIHVRSVCGGSLRLFPLEQEKGGHFFRSLLRGGRVRLGAGDEVA